MHFFSFIPPIKLIEEGKWLLSVTSFEATNFVFKTTIENSLFPINIPSHWQTKSAGKTINELNTLLELRSQNGVE